MSPAMVIVPAALASVAAIVVWSSMSIAVSHGPWSIATVIALGVLAVAADVDRRELRLPDALVGLAAVPLVAVVLLAFAAGAAVVAAAVVAGALVAAAPVGVLHLVSPTSMGFGDVKAAAVLGGAVGVVEWRLALVAVCVAAVTAAASVLVHRRRTVAFGPFLVAAGWAVVGAVALAGRGVLPWR